MAQIVVMPKLGLTAREALLQEWLVEEGESVNVGDPLFEIETDKIVSEIEASVGGTLLRKVDSGVVVPVGAAIAIIGEPSEDVSHIALYSAGAISEDPESSESELAMARGGGGEPEADGGSAQTSLAGGRVSASPLARKRARELGVELVDVGGSGPGGRIRVEDVEKVASAVGATTDAVARPMTGRTETPTRLRRAIAAAMSLSATVPQFSLERSVDVTRLMTLLEQLSTSTNASISLADAIGVATARGIARYQVFLRQWNEGMFEYAEGVHLGLAVAVEDGLIVPVIRDADSLSVEEFSVVRRGLQRRTREGALTVQESTGAVFTISNLGPFGIDRFQALVNPPESGILAVGRARERGGDQRFVTMVLSADHRVVDGVQAASLLAEISRLLEDPEGHDELLALRARSGLVAGPADKKGSPPEG